MKEFVILKVAKDAFSRDARVTIHQYFESDKKLTEAWNFWMDREWTIPSSLAEYHKVYWHEHEGQYYAPEIKQYYKLTEEN